MTTKVNLNEKFGLFTEHWRPKVIAALNGQGGQNYQGDGTGSLASVVSMGPGECVVVPHGVEHRTCADGRSGSSLLRAERCTEYGQCER